MFTITETKEITYTVKDIKQYTINFAHKAKGVGWLRGTNHRKNCLKLLCGWIRENRWELLDTFGPYKVILNGYGEFKQIEGEDRTVKADEIFRRMEQIENNC